MVYELAHDKTYSDMCVQWRLRSAWASTQSDQSLCCPHEESLGLYLPIECKVKTDQSGRMLSLIRSLRWACMPSCRFFHALAHIWDKGKLISGDTWGKAQMSMHVSKVWPLPSLSLYVPKTFFLLAHLSKSSGWAIVITLCLSSVVRRQQLVC